MSVMGAHVLKEADSKPFRPSREELNQLNRLYDKSNFSLAVKKLLKIMIKRLVCTFLSFVVKTDISNGAPQAYKNLATMVNLSER